MSSPEAEFLRAILTLIPYSREVPIQSEAPSPHPTSCLSLDSNPQLLGQGRLSESLPSLSANPYWMSKHLQEKSSSTHARAYLPWMPALHYIFSFPISPSRCCFTFFSWANCSEEGVWQELPVLRSWEWKSCEFHFRDKDT